MTRASTRTTLTRPCCARRADARILGRLCRFVAAVAFLLVAALLPSAAAAQSFSDESSTAVADFNADGRPDLAVANHIGDRSSAAYRIDFTLSNGLSQTISFASAQRALRVAAIDVDNDHDLDLVITPVLGRDIVGVWLNDGTGHFRQGNPDSVPSDCARLSTTGISGCPPQFAVATAAPRRLIADTPSSMATMTRASGAFRARPAPIAAASRLLLCGLSPRAPPSGI
jgi:FG-GAP-like repeat